MQQAMAEVGGKSVILISPTGSGKTLACAIPLLLRLKPGLGLGAAVIAPSRELAIQIAGVFAALAPEMRVISVYGGHPVIDETRAIEAGMPDIIVGTPGRILDHLKRGTFSLAHTPYLLLDEYDKSLELGFEAEMKRIVNGMKRVRFMLLSSATEIAELPEFMNLEAPTVMDFRGGEDSKSDLNIRMVHSPVPDKLETLAELLNSIPRERTIVFVNHRESAERIQNFLKSWKFPSVLYHGALDQHDRETALDVFTNGSSPILVATDLAARGLDIQDVESVIHYHLPASPEAWTHRNGRTARMGASGFVYIIVGPGENCPYAVESEDFVPSPEANPWRKQVMTLWFHEGKKEKLSRGDVAGALIRVAGLAPDEVGLISVHDHRILAAVPAKHAAGVASLLSKSKIKGRKIRVTLV